ncbi:MAG: acyl-CoA thioesterase II [Acidimicrobiales bacterium]|nr:MAG: acyl-CoA thioesterase II [Acidimicrobiales bacterium]
MLHPLTGQPAVDQLVALLDLEKIEVGVFRGDSPDVSPQRVFGGQVAGQALIAAGRCVPQDRVVHSLHAYFIRPGDSSVPILFHVENVRDGSSFSVRRVVAVQHGVTIFFMSASFQRPEEGLDHYGQMPTDIPAPEELRTLMERLEPVADRLGVWGEIARPIDVRYVGAPGWLENRPAEPKQRVWMRADGRLPDDPQLHACALTYASDLTLLDGVLATHGEVWGPGGFTGASLDHAVWFHRPFRADEWILYDCESPSASGARGLATARCYTAAGQHVATVVQEGLLRPVGDRLHAGK